jgi:hypothetical protein
MMLDLYEGTLDRASVTGKNHRSNGSSPTDGRHFREVQFACGLPNAPVFQISMAKLVRASPYFRKLLDEESYKPENQGAIVMTVSYMNCLPGILRMMLSWVETGELLETHTLEEYANIPSEEDTSPWMMMIQIYHAADRFEMLELKDTIMYKIVEMCFASGTVPCGTLRAIYTHTKAGDGIRRLIIDLTAYRVPSTVYRTYFLSWTLEILQDLLIAVKDARAEEPYASGIEKYLSKI